MLCALLDLDFFMNTPEQKAKTSATLIGYCGLFFWTIAAALVASVENIPIFQVLSTALGVSFSVTALYLTFTKRWFLLKQPLLLWIVGILGIFGNDVLYIAAFKFAPPVQADLIAYLWPIFVIVFSGLLPREKFSIKHVLAGILGFAGVCFLITEGEALSSFQLQYLPGYCFALGSAIVWSIYTLIARHYGKTRSEMIGLYCGFGMLFSIVAHFQFETTVTPTSTQWFVMLIMGLTTQGLAYFFWDFGIKRGNFKLLNVLSYGNPVLSVLLLIVFGFAQPSFSLFIACILVTAGGLIASISWSIPLKYIQTCYQELPFKQRRTEKSL